MRKKAAGILKAVWTIVISVALISAGLMCLSLQKQVEELSRLPKNVLKTGKVIRIQHSEGPGEIYAGRKNRKKRNAWQ